MMYAVSADFVTHKVIEKDLERKEAIEIGIMLLKIGARYVRIGHWSENNDEYIYSITKFTKYTDDGYLDF